MATEKRNHQVKEPFRFDVRNFYPLFFYSYESPSYALWNAPLSYHTYPLRDVNCHFSASGSKTQTDVSVDADTYCRNVGEFRVIQMVGTSPTRRLALDRVLFKRNQSSPSKSFTDTSSFHQALSSLKVVSLGRRRRCNFLLPLTATAGSNRLGNGRRGGQSIHGAAAL